MLYIYIYIYIQNIDATPVQFSAIYLPSSSLFPLVCTFSLGFADAALAPIDFPTAPVAAMSKVLSACELTKDDIEMFEINEAFSVVALANIKIMELNPDRVNVHGGRITY